MQAVLSGHTHTCWHGEPAEGQPFHQIIGGGRQLTRTNWSPTPATLTEITANPRELNLRVAEVATGNELVKLKLTPVA